MSDPKKKHKTQSKNPSKRSPNKKEPVNKTSRAFLIVILILISLLMFVGFFAKDAAVLAFIHRLFAWLVGPGVYVVPFCALLAAIYCIVKFSRRVKPSWILALMQLPVLAGAFAHLIVTDKNYFSGIGQSIKQLCIDGTLNKSGGFIAGGFANILRACFSSVGAWILLIVFTLGVLFVVLRISFASLLSSLSDKAENKSEEKRNQRIYRQAERHERRQIEKEEEERVKAEREETERILREQAAIQARASSAYRKIDFELDDVPPADPGIAPKNKPQPSGKKSRTAQAESPISVSFDNGAVPPVPLTQQTDVAESSGYTLFPSEAVSDKVKVTYSGEHSDNAYPVPATDFTGPDLPAAEDLPEEKIYSEELPSLSLDSDIPDEISFVDDTGVFPEINQMIPPAEDNDIDSLFEDSLTDDSILPEEDFNSDFPSEASPEGTPSAPSKPKISQQELDEEILRTAAEASALSKQDYVYPPIDLLKSSPAVPRGQSAAETEANQEKLISTLSSFGVEASIVGVTRGPAVTRYEIQLGSGIKISRISSLSEDIALAMGAQSVRVSDIPEKYAVGIEVPNRNIETVTLRDVIESKDFSEQKSTAIFALGKDISGKPVVGDISRLPHLLVGGTTNSGKSVCINSLLISLIYKASPDELRFILIDPKMVEFASYNGIPHLLIPVVTDFKKAAGALQWAVLEMEDRYKKFNENGFRNFNEYNDGCEALGFQKLPRIVIVIDELADLMMTSPKEVEAAICRLAQKARAAGMNLVVATQRPSSDVIKGTMKANIPSRIAFSVASSLESRIILDRNGAETLLGRGDMLFLPIGATKPRRVQGCFVSSKEIEDVVEFIKKDAVIEYNEEIMHQIDRAADGNQRGDFDEDSEEDRDEMFDEAVSICIGMNQCSATMLQRRLKIGFARASRVVDQMEAAGIVGPSEGAKPRAMLISKEDWAEMQHRKTYD